MSERTQLMERWLANELAIGEHTITPASSDASFRRYFRVTGEQGSAIVMDAPPDKEDCGPFIQVTRMLWALGLNVPELRELNRDQGFLLLGDLGSRPYLDELNEDTVERLYGDALAALAVMQARGPNDDELPPYDRALLNREMDLFRDWLVGEHLQLALSEGERAGLDRTRELLADSALAQPRVFVHRDYHSRNLMITERNNPGIIDYQDAVIGPLTYDLVSLLRDCYVRWPRERVEDWALGYLQLAEQSGILREKVSERQFLQWFDWMGVQRHLKAAGIFARLNHRDGKPGYLADIPRTLGYVTEVAAGYPELEALGRLVADRVLPALGDG